MKMQAFLLAVSHSRGQKVSWLMASAGRDLVSARVNGGA